MSTSSRMGASFRGVLLRVGETDRDSRTVEVGYFDDEDPRRTERDGWEHDKSGNCVDHGLRRL